ncbi:MAG: hypothetical protein Q9218_006495 [Villophora microphyllina]
MAAVWKLSALSSFPLRSRGAGVAALSNASVTDFVIVEYRGDIGGRVAHADFGRKPDGTPYSDFDSITTFNETGPVDFTRLLDEFEDAYSILEQDAGRILTQNLQDRSMRSGLSLAGWKAGKDAAAQTVEWWEFDFEYAFTPNATFYQYSDQNNYVFDERGFNAFIKGEASTFLKNNDQRLLLNTVVTNITYDGSGVTVHNQDGSCIQADYAICTFSLGVLQSDGVTFDPELPSWKQEGIETFSMGTYTKIFLQFPPDKVFWNISYQFFLYADPHERGYYPVFQSLDAEGFLPGSGIIFVTVLQSQSYVVEAQDDETTKAEVLAVLRSMFGADKVPEPIAFLYPRWSLEPWAYGSYSNWPLGTTLEMHQNLRANVGRLYFAGEATSAEYFGFLQGAWFEGQAAGETIAGLIKKTDSTGEVHYETLHGTTPENQYDAANGWQASTFLTRGHHLQSNTMADAAVRSASLQADKFSANRPVEDDSRTTRNLNTTHKQTLQNSIGTKPNKGYHTVYIPAATNMTDTEQNKPAAVPKKPIDLSGHEKSPHNFVTPFGPHQNPLRSHLNVMSFCTPPAETPAKETVQESIKTENIRPIASIPSNLPEEKFARVKYLGEFYWISREHEEETKSVGGDYVVVNKDDAASMKTANENQTKEEK